MKQLILLGASGSIGEQTLDVIEKHPDKFSLVAFSVGKRVEKVHDILRKFPVKQVCVQFKEDAEHLKAIYPDIQFYSGDEGLLELVSLAEGNTVVNALVGFAGLMPTLTAIEHGKDIALANKETLVVGGRFVKEAVKKHHVQLTPIDSEHSAIFQCLQGLKPNECEKLIITASGGSFRDRTHDECADVTVEQALNHPNWSMGAKITIDSATMMNKGFEVIEAHYLFDLDYDKIDVLIHRESMIHSMIQTIDKAILAQLGSADMRLPIQYALSYPERYELNIDSCDLASIACLHFGKVPQGRYPLFEVAYDCGKKEGNACAILNAANEVAVGAFLERKISFLDIERLVFKALKSIPYISYPSLEEVIHTDQMTRTYVKECLKGDF